MAEATKQGQSAVSQLGWSRQALDQVLRAAGERAADPAAVRAEAGRFGSPVFKQLWALDSRRVSSQKAQQLLAGAMACVGMPAELSGSPEETQALLAQIDANLAPHDGFWRLFSRTLQRAFPYDDFSQKDGRQELKRQLHQFRYVISCQQAQWVRERFRGLGMTDAEALATYFKTYPGLPYSFSESSRLHNKAYIDQQDSTAAPLYPDGQTKQANIKILLAFHTEFILDMEGYFLNILDPEGSSQNGLVNGASFNYGDRNRPGNQASHTRYDVRTPGPWDPAFRRQVAKNQGRSFKSPQNNRGPLGYHGRTSRYAIEGRSAKQSVDREIRRFKALLGRPLIFLRWWGWLRRLWPRRRQI